MRPARLEDATALVGLYDELADRPGAEAGDAPTLLGALEQIVADPARHLLVAELAGEPAGTADVLVAPNLTHHAKPWAIVENVVVAGRARRRGVGTALMGEIAEIARAAGCYKVMLLSGSERVEAHAFYAALGYRITSKGFKLYLD